MAERNLIKEGFINNTSAPDGSVSGTQTVSIPEMNILVDEDFSTTAVTVTGSFFTSLDADLGARWKLTKVELYTDEPDPLNFDMNVSEDNIEFSPLTMTGSAGLWTGSVSGTTVSGAPRYIRYEHRATVDRTIQEWRAMSDDTLVDFGTTGIQTSVEIADAPIGKPSDQITTLPLFNRANQTVQGFVFIDNTGTAADENIEISTSPNGPWFGKQQQDSKQPDSLPWTKILWSGLTLDEFEGHGGGTFFTNVATVTGTAYVTDFSENNLRGWVGVGFTSVFPLDNSIKGTISTTTAPAFALHNTFDNDEAKSPWTSPALFNGFTAFRAEHYDTVEIYVTTPYIPPADFVESTRLFWRDHTGADYSSDQSVMSTTSGANFTGLRQKFTFDVGAVPTWSGVIRSLKVQPFTTATGVSLTSTMHSLEVYNGDKRERVALNLDTVIEGTFTSENTLGGQSDTTFRTVINTENPVKEPCIITFVSCGAKPGTVADTTGFFLVRFKDGFEYLDRPDEVNASDPFEVLHIAVSEEVRVNWASSNASIISRPVFWKAEPGDMIGFTYRSYSAIQKYPVVTYDSNLTVTSGGCLKSSNYSDISSSSTNSSLSASLNSVNSWKTEGRRYNVQFKAISAGKYVSTGAYTTPIFDGGASPALLSFEYESKVENGTSIDVTGGAAFNTVNARASSTTPDTSTGLGRRITEFPLGAHPTGRPDPLDPIYTSNYVIGLFNEEVQSRENSSGLDGDNSIENFGASVLYHENKNELWVLNLIISGTLSNDMRPTWDAYDLDSGSYLRTQHVTGSINYVHQNNGESTDVNVFEPVGWVADYDREEIYIVTREDEFHIGNGAYHGLILDLDGNFKNVMWRSDQVLQDIIAAGVEADLTDAGRRIANMRTVTYRAPYFYTLTAGSTNNSVDRLNAVYSDVLRLGNNPAVPDDTNDVEFISGIDLSAVTGLTFISSSRPVETMTYCSDNDLFYITVRDGNEIHTVDFSSTGTVPTESFIATKGPISETTYDSIAMSTIFSRGFSSGNTTGGLNNWEGAGEIQEIKHFTDWTYSSARDSFVFLFFYLSSRSRNLVRFGEYSDDYFLWRWHNHSMVAELAANAKGTSSETPKLPNYRDSTWSPISAISGTLFYDALQENSILFPTGRYAQLQYVLNSSTDRQFTPYLIESSVAQGIRVSNIPASGTKDIFLRTNIPATSLIGDQEGSLKVYWELQES